MGIHFLPLEKHGKEICKSVTVSLYEYLKYVILQLLCLKKRRKFVKIQSTFFKAYEAFQG